MKGKGAQINFLYKTYYFNKKFLKTNQSFFLANACEKVHQGGGRESRTDVYSRIPKFIDVDQLTMPRFSEFFQS